MQPRYKDYWGYEINMMEELVRRLDFTYEIVNPPDAAWGMINETGQWTGLTGMASRGDADSGASTGIEVIGIIGDFLPNFARFQVGENVLQVLTPNGTTSISVLAFKLLFAKLRITATRSMHLHPPQVCQTTIFHDRDFFTFASPLPTVKPRFFSLTRPFGLEVWAMIMATVLITGIAFFFISNIEVNQSSRFEVPRTRLFLVLCHLGLTCWI